MTLEIWLNKIGSSRNTVAYVNLATTGIIPTKSHIFAIGLSTGSSLTNSREYFLKYPLYTPDISGVQYTTGISVSDYFQKADYLDAVLPKIIDDISGADLLITYAKKNFFLPILEQDAISIFNKPLIDIGELFFLLDLGVNIFCGSSSTEELSAKIDTEVDKLLHSGIDKIPPLSSLINRYSLDASAKFRTRIESLNLLGQIALTYEI